MSAGARIDASDPAPFRIADRLRPHYPQFPVRAALLVLAMLSGKAFPSNIADPSGASGAVAFLESLTRWTEANEFVDAESNGGMNDEAPIPYVKVTHPASPYLESYVERTIGFEHTKEASYSTMHDAGRDPENGRLVAPVAGIYEFMANIEFNNYGPVRFLYYGVVRKNGAEGAIVARAESDRFTYYRDLKLNGTAQLNAGESLELHVYQASGETLRFRAEFQMWWVGDEGSAMLDPEEPHTADHRGVR